MNRARGDQTDEIDQFYRDLLLPIDDFVDPEVPLRYPKRDVGRAPGQREDPYNAIIRFCEVKGAETGILSGKRIGVKDKIPVGGIPMTSGQHWTSPPVPAEDAVVVERLLDAGATITAKTNISDGSGNAAFGDARNPHDDRYSPGFSSSGSGSAVVSGLVDGALGTDIAGSVRIPAAWCGVVGMKPSRGLVPLHGISDRVLNTIGPITATVTENAAMLTVMAGADWRDPDVFSSSFVSADYTSAAGLGISNIRIGVISDSLEPSGCTVGTLKGFDRAQKILIRLGAEVSNVTVPLWTSLAKIYWPNYILGKVEPLPMQSGYGNRGRIDVLGMSELESEIVLGASARVIGFFRHEHDMLRRFSKAKNLVLELHRQIEELLVNFDLLITPTTVTGPFELNRKPNVNVAAANTWACNLTGHPALTVPNGTGDNNLPTGLQIIGRRFDEYTIYRAAFAYESATV